MKGWLKPVLCCTEVQGNDLFFKCVMKAYILFGRGEMCAFFDALKKSDHTEVQEAILQKEGTFQKNEKIKEE